MGQLFYAGRLPALRRSGPPLEPESLVRSLRCGKCGHLHHRCDCGVDGDRIRDEQYDEDTRS